MLGHQSGIGQTEGRRGVHDHQIIATSADDIPHQLAHALGTEQPRWIGRLAAGGEQIPASETAHRLDHRAPVERFIGEQVAEPAHVVQTQAVVDLRFAHVRVHQQHPLAHFTEGLGQQHHHQALALRGDRGGEGDRADRLVAVQEAQAGGQVAEGLLILEFLVGAEAGIGSINGLQQEALVGPYPLEDFEVGDVSQQGLVQLVVHFGGGVEHMVHLVAEQGGTTAGQQAQQQGPQQSWAHLRFHRIGIDPGR